jgi:hypothetical protein
MPAFYEWDVRVRVPSYAVAQGGIVDREMLGDALSEAIPEAHDGDIQVMITKAPSADSIRKEQA